MMAAVPKLRQMVFLETAYVLMIHPLVLGEGRRLFPESSALATLRLVAAKPTDTGVVVATYQPADSREN
jgi:dihydrofolate reductase